jgi:hypothetical protein
VGVSGRGRAVIENGSICHVRPEDKMATDLQMAILLFYHPSDTILSNWANKVLHGLKLIFKDELSEAKLSSFPFLFFKIKFWRNHFEIKYFLELKDFKIQYFLERNWQTYMCEYCILIHERITSTIVRVVTHLKFKDEICDVQNHRFLYKKVIPYIPNPLNLTRFLTWVFWK